MSKQLAIERWAQVNRSFGINLYPFCKSKGRGDSRGADRALAFVYLWLFSIESDFKIVDTDAVSRVFCFPKKPIDEAVEIALDVGYATRDPDGALNLSGYMRYVEKADKKPAGRKKMEKQDCFLGGESDE